MTNSMVWMGAPLIYHSIRAPIQPMRMARRILEPILFCQAIEIKDPTSLFFEDADKFL